MKQLHDYYFKKAKSDNYVARSVYKLEEIDAKYRLLRQNIRVLDLGCAPGSWLQYLIPFKGSRGVIVGIDLKIIDEKISQEVHFLQRDIYEIQTAEITAFAREFDLVVSDMAPNTMGIKSVDHLRSIELCSRSLEIASMVLTNGGNYLVKIFQGGDFSQFTKLVRAHFEKVQIVKPKASRKESKEIFILGQNFKKSVPEISV
jgi:23S rRNA (uridine2552-2'-O)-methyltransferase